MSERGSQVVGWRLRDELVDEVKRGVGKEVHRINHENRLKGSTATRDWTLEEFGRLGMRLNKLEQLLEDGDPRVDDDQYFTIGEALILQRALIAAWEATREESDIVKEQLQYEIKSLGGKILENL